MEIIILSKKQKTYFNEKFIEHSRELTGSNIQVKVINPNNCKLYLEDKLYKIFDNNEIINNSAYVIPRIPTNHLEYSLNIIRHLEANGIRIINGSAALEKCSNKLKILHNLQNIEGIKIPKTVLVKNPKDIKYGISLAGGFPVVLKISPNDEKGLGPILVNNLSYAESFLDLNFMFAGLLQPEKSILIQEFIKGSIGKTINYLVLGSNILTAYISKRTIANELTFDALKKNIPDFIEISPENRNLVLTIAKAFGLDFGIVSIIESHQGKFVIDVDPMPDVEEIEKNYQIEIISRLLRYVICNYKI